MPWRVERRDSCPDSRPWAVVLESDGSTVACHGSKASARRHLRALYASEDKSRAAGAPGDTLSGVARRGQWQTVGRRELRALEGELKHQEARATMELEHKDVPISGFKVLDDDQGIVETIVSVTGIEDRVKDVIEPGAYEKTLRRRMPKGVSHHDITSPVAKTLRAEELLPGDPRLPTETKDGEPWPREAGGLLIETMFNLDTQRGREAYSDVKFFGDEQEWSVGYRAVRPRVDRKTGVRHIPEMDLYEYSPVLFGAMPLARSVSVKDALQQVREVAADQRDPSVVALLDAIDGVLDAKAEDETKKVHDFRGRRGGNCRICGEAFDHSSHGGDKDDEGKEWVEEDHDRDEHGRFSSGGGGDSSGGGGDRTEELRSAAGDALSKLGAEEGDYDQQIADFEAAVAAVQTIADERQDETPPVVGVDSGNTTIRGGDTNYGNITYDDTQEDGGYGAHDALQFVAGTETSGPMDGRDVEITGIAQAGLEGYAAAGASGATLEEGRVVAIRTGPDGRDYAMVAGRDPDTDEEMSTVAPVDALTDTGTGKGAPMGDETKDIVPGGSVASAASSQEGQAPTPPVQLVPNIPQVIPLGQAPAPGSDHDNAGVRGPDTTPTSPAPTLTQNAGPQAPAPTGRGAAAAGTAMDFWHQAHPFVPGGPNGGCAACGWAEGEDVHSGWSPAPGGAVAGATPSQTGAGSPGNPRVSGVRVNVGGPGLVSFTGSGSPGVPKSLFDDEVAGILDGKIDVSLSGSWEETQRQLREQGTEALKGAGQLAGDGWVSLEATYPDSVVFCVYGNGGSRYWKATWSTGDDGRPSLGVITEVEITALVTAKALEDGDFAPVVELLDEIKAGRVLSGANAGRIKAAVQSLVDVLASAGIEIEAPSAEGDDGKAEEVDEQKAMLEEIEFGAMQGAQMRMRAGLPSQARDEPVLTGAEEK